MSRLFSYTVRVDDGAAANPFGGICTLAICKPRIRRVAKPGDWIVGLGSSNAPSGDLAGHVVYAMCVTEVHTLAEYDKLAPQKIPDITSLDMHKRLGDGIYDYSQGDRPTQRPGVHAEGNRKTDLCGKNVLMSEDFYYFGDRAIRLPEDLLPICHQTQGQKSTLNQPYFDAFVSWIHSMGLKKGQLYGRPDHVIDWNLPEGCADVRRGEWTMNMSLIVKI